MRVNASMPEGPHASIFGPEFSSRFAADAADDEAAAAGEPSRRAAAIDSDLDDDNEGRGPGVTPSFVEQAERAARWRRPWVRALLSLMALGLLALLAAQLALTQRDLLAAQWPASRPLLQALCEAAACRIEPLRRIDQIAVDSSGLTRVEGAPLYRLAVVLHNKSELPLKLPSVELSATDPQGQLIARRVLQPAELSAPGDTIGAGQELSLQALLSAGERRMSGYTIEIFYP
jgi:hypothetical protein